MPVSHARVTSSADSLAFACDQVPGLLEVLALVPDPRRQRGRRYGRPHPLRRKITAPSEKRLRTLQALDAAVLDMLIGGWLAGLAAAG